MIESVAISLWAVPLTIQQHLKLSSIIELRGRTALQNTQMLCRPRVLQSRRQSSRNNPGRSPLRADSGQAEENYCRLTQTAEWTYTHFGSLNVMIID